MSKQNQNKIAFSKSLVIMQMLFVMFFIDINQVKAANLSDIFSNSVIKVKNILSIKNNQTEIQNLEKVTQSVDESLDFVLKTNTKNIVEKNSTDTKISVLKDGDVMQTAVGPMRAATEDELVQNDTIAVYEVKEGDTLKDIAALYNVSKNTIVWANDIKNGKVIVGDTLIILPISGVKHKIKKGDTLASIAKKYKADENDIADFNNVKNTDLIVSVGIGEEIIIPDGEIYFDAPAKKKDNTIKKPKQKRIYASAGEGYYVRPIIGGIKTQGLHGHNGIDIGAPVGSVLLAAAGGTIQLAKQGGYNGGYGSMIIISHPNGTQTLYAHMSQVYVTSGQSVVQGEQIGTSGNSGKSTGPHLHFEVRGAANPF